MRRERLLGLHNLDDLEEEHAMLNNSIHRSLHLKLDDHEKRRVSAVFDQVDILKKEVSQLQESLQNSYKNKRVKSSS